MSSPPAIELRDVTFSYGGRPVLERASIEIPACGMASIVGPNGGGKTTFLKLCLGLLRPQAGVVRVLGSPPERARRSVGYVPQQFAFDDRFPVTAMDVVLMGRLGRIAGFFGRADRDRGRAALEEVGLGDLAPAPFADLSGGQRQRVLVARALVTEPRLLLLDEPTSSVDPEAQLEIQSLIRSLSDRLTVVVVTHDMHFVGAGVEEVVCVNRTVAVHPTREVVPGLELAHLGDGVRLVDHEERRDGTRGGAPAGRPAAEGDD